MSAQLCRLIPFVKQKKSLNNYLKTLIMFCCFIYFPKILEPNIKTRINKTRKIKNNTLAIEAAPAAIPVKPNMAATIAMIKNMAAHLSI